MKKTILRFLTAGLLSGWMMGIFLFSHQPAVESSEISGTVSLGLVGRIDALLQLDLPKETIERIGQLIEYPVRKAAHMAEYAILGMLAYAFFRAMEIGKERHYPAAWIFAICYAATDEIHQLFVPGRSGSIYDVCIDGAGAAAGLLFLFLIRKSCHFKRKIRESIAKRG